MPILRAFAELNETGRRINVHFKYNPDAVAAVKEVPGRKFHPDAQPKHWSIPADIVSARRLRQAFGEGLQLGEAVTMWGREAANAERQMRSIKRADDAKLDNVNGTAHKWLRPYQRADVKMMALGNVGNFNQPGVGKTVEAIYAVQEAGLYGPHIVVCPTSLFKDPWREELARHAPDARVLWGATPEERRAAIEEASRLQDLGEAGNVWLLLNPEIIRVKKVGAEEDLPANTWILSKDHKGNAYIPKDATADLLFNLKIGALVADEFHKFGLGEDRNTLYARGLKSLRANAQRAWAMSGTPIGGKEVRLWGILNFIEPERFPGKWKWAQQWLTNGDGTGPVDPGAGTGIGGLVKGREQEFEQAHSQYINRRTRLDALPGMPPKKVIDVWCDMTKRQAKVYSDFIHNTEVEIDGGRLSATGILAEFQRAKQLANALCEFRDGVLQPTTESGKLPILLDHLDTQGVRAKGAEPGARAIVASESQRFVFLVTGYLIANGIQAIRLDGTVTGERRDAVIDWYKAKTDDARVLVMTTQTGGVGLNLGMTDSIHVLDETWNPDDQEQLEDRGMRDRKTPLIVYYYRSRDTIQEYVHEVARGKKITNKNVLDIQRKMKGAR